VHRKRKLLWVIDTTDFLCVDNVSSCPTGTTCCLMQSGWYGCCPIENAICCADKLHCCTQDQICDNEKTLCLDRNATHSKIETDVIDDKSPLTNNAEWIVCPDEVHMCPDEHTCCKMTGGKYGCCPLPEAVCCSDEVHCCPKGNKCGPTGCEENGIILPFADASINGKKAFVKNIKIKKSHTFSAVTCPDGESECPSGNTCCTLKSGDYGCCPLPDAVCCADKEHCCPHGYNCESGSCVMNDYIMPHSSLLEIGQQNDVENSLIGKLLADSSVICPDHASECASGNTCCKLRSGDWGCCPLPQAVCCADQEHCCPNGYSCAAGGMCMKNLNVLLNSNVSKIEKQKLIKSTLDEKLDSLSAVICPDHASTCASGNTCCKLQDGEWGCCPMPQAVCCADQIHCCPHDTKCDVSSSACIKNNLNNKFVKSIPWFTKLPALKTKKNGLNDTTCPDKSLCSDGSTCCLLRSGKYGCCPMPNAVCCADGLHCCPEGTHCDTIHSSCMSTTSSLSHSFTDIQMRKTVQTKENNSLEKLDCPDNSTCAGSSTCCLLSSGSYGCCPFKDAICCSDHIHCCPSGSKCNVKFGNCESLSSSLSHSLEEINIKRHLNGLKKSLNNDNLMHEGIICPDKKSKCSSDATCCLLDDGEYGCCPMEKAVCCSDHVHCCPEGYTCDVSAGTCVATSSNQSPLKIVSFIEDKSTSKIQCPSVNVTCDNGHTCCLSSDGEYGCCPFSNAVCCEDHKHCCPSGAKCDTSKGQCLNENPHIAIPWSKKKPATYLNTTNLAQLICPDHVSECPSGTTCCLLSSGSWGCCPFPHAVCCEDKEHCCPSGYTCEVSSGLCKKSAIDHSPLSALKIN